MVRGECDVNNECFSWVEEVCILLCDFPEFFVGFVVEGFIVIAVVAAGYNNAVDDEESAFCDEGLYFTDEAHFSGVVLK